MNRIGFAKDIHRLVEGRKLILGGVVIPFEKGELAHSDGDVLYHAIGEAILGALSLGDLGKYFPDSSDETLDMDSALIVDKIYKMMSERGYRIVNVDASIVLEKPKLRDYIDDMRSNVANVLHVEDHQVSIKAGTNEGCGELGRNEAIEATAIVLLEKI